MKTSLLKFAGILSFASIISLSTLAYTKAEGNEIAVCVKKGGLMYVIGGEFKKKECKYEDSLLSWSTGGTQGPKGDKGDAGPVGPQGIKGDTGSQGDVGPMGPQGQNSSFSSTFIVTNTATSGPNQYSGATLPVDATCPEGSILLSGGATTSFDVTFYPDVVLSIGSSYPYNSSTWRGVGLVSHGPTGVGRMTVTTYALCANTN